MLEGEPRDTVEHARPQRSRDSKPQRVDRAPSGSEEEKNESKPGNEAQRQHGHPGLRIRRAHGGLYSNRCRSDHESQRGLCANEDRKARWLVREAP